MGAAFSLAIGQVLSIVFFVVGYRRTVGARKARAQAAQAEIERLFIKRVVVDNYDPTLTDIARAIRRKAQQNQVKQGDLPSAEQIAIAIYIDVLENDFVQPSERTVILKRLDALLTKDASSYERQRSAKSSMEDGSLIRQRTQLTGLVGALAALGGTVAGVAGLSISDSDFARSVIPATAGVSVLSVALLALVIRVRDQGNEVSVDGLEYQRGVKFHSDTCRALEQRGYALVTHVPGKPAADIDYTITVKARKVGLALRGHRKYTGRNLTTLATRRLRDEDLDSFGLDEVVIVVPTKPAGVGELPERVSIRTPPELMSYVDRI